MKQNDDARIGATIRSFRVQAGLSLEELAERVGVSVPLLQRYELGLSSLPAALVAPIARYAGATVVSILGGDDQPLPDGRRDRSRLTWNRLYDRIDPTKRTAVIKFVSAALVKDEAL